MKTPGSGRRCAAWFAGMVTVAGPLPLAAAEVDIPFTFSAGQPAVAAEVNANFAAVDAAVDDNAARILALESATASEREVFSLSLDRTFTGSAVVYTVPADRILVIEAIGILAWIAASLDSDSARLEILPSNLPAGTPINRRLDIRIPLMATGRVERGGFATTGLVDFRYGVGNLSTRLYAAPGHRVLIGLPTLANGSDETSGVINMSGYLLPSDSPSLAP